MHIEFTKQYNTLLRKAVTFAVGEGATIIERKHLFSAICDMAPRLFCRLLGRKTLLYAEGLPIKEGSADPDKELAFSSGSYRVLSLSGGILGEVMKAVGACCVNVQHVAAALLLDADDTGPVQEFLLVNGVDQASARPGIIDAVGRMSRAHRRNGGRDALKKVNSVRAMLLERIIGQDDAIDSICDALFEFWSSPPEERRRPLSIFICGASGSGKTLLADTLGEAVGKVTGTEKIDTLSSGLYSSRDSSRDLVGRDASWRGGAVPGAYTLPIFDKPNGVICLDNVEQLHSVALNHVLRAITTGTLKDDCTGELVDYRNAVCIFISSIGGDRASASEALKNVSTLTRQRLVEELCAELESGSSAQRNIRAMVEQNDVVVLMRSLDVDGLSALMRRAVERQFASVRQSAKSLCVDCGAVSDLLVQTIASLDPRAIDTIVGDVVKPLRKVMMGQPDVWRKIKDVHVVVEGAEPLRRDVVTANLHMRKRQTVTSCLLIDGDRATLSIRATGLIMLPALQDGIVCVTPPNEADSFDHLVGMSAPLMFVNRWKRYFAGEIDIKPENLLLCGPPGCGKTSMVRALAADLRKPFAILNCNDLSSPDAIIKAFAAIRRYAGDGLLVFMDELDAVAGNRDGKSEMYLDRINLLLQEIDGFRQNSTAKVMYIGATNRSSSLDSAIMRSGRFGQTIVFSPLGEDERRQLVKLAANEFGATLGEALETFIVETTDGFPPATIKGIVREMKLATESSSYTRNDYLRARDVVIEGVCTQPTLLTERTRYSVAIHEAGHALYCDMCGERKFVQVSIVGNGDKLGFLEQQRDSGEVANTKKELLDTIDIYLAGRAAEEVALGAPTDGAIDDIEKATFFAIQYIKGGFSGYGLGIPPAGLAWTEISPIARKILDERYNRVKHRLCREKMVLRRLADLLVEKKVVFQDELRAIRRGVRPGMEVNHGEE